MQFQDLYSNSTKPGVRTLASRFWGSAGMKSTLWWIVFQKGKLINAKRSAGNSLGKMGDLVQHNG